MAHAKMTVGMYVPAQPPLGDVRQLVLASRALRLDSMMVWDHVQDFIPRAIWDTDLTWAAARSTSPHE
jgi:phthiodiolone/phenolphthiodiolone dimycocerosates ketoreductase